jgi:tryptophan synthase alpha chain
MGNKIDLIFHKRKSLKLMTHVLAGYPDMETSRKLIKAMEKSGADIIEIQIPFSDPLADGPTIMAANEQALKNGVTPVDCLALAAELKGKVEVPLLFMTYVNIAYSMGMERFVARSAECGISGLIIPDLPRDEINFGYYSYAERFGIHAVPVVSAGISVSRLKAMVKNATGFIYVTLRVGITGAARTVDPGGLRFIESVRKHSSLPIAAGFGISSMKHAELLKGHADMIVMGSHLIDLYNSGGTPRVSEFIRECRSLILEP